MQKPLTRENESACFLIVRGGTNHMALSDEEVKTQARKKLKSTQEPMEKVRLQCLTRGCAGIKELGRLFEIIDDDGSRKLDVKEMKKGLKDYGIQMTEDELKNLLNQLDTDQSGTIDFDEFLMALRPPMSNSRQKIILAAYEKLDKSGNGQITIDDLNDVYDVTNNQKFRSGGMTRQQIFNDFLKAFQVGKNADGVVTRDEFLNYYSGVSASIDNDAYFDLMMRNAWKL